jgi:uncharacterized damage-inducible protein DinB
MKGPAVRTETDEKLVLATFRRQGHNAMFALCDGLSDEQLRQRLVPSLTTILGMVKHLAYVERWWFQDVFDGRPCEYPWSDSDMDADFRIEPEESTAEILELYRNECAESAVITERHELDDISINHTQRPPCTLRWTILHMIEETARHAGQADILRELLDGRTGLGEA